MSITDCYVLLLSPKGEVNDFNFVHTTSTHAVGVVWSLARSGSTILAAWLTDEAGTQCLDPAVFNWPDSPAIPDVVIWPD